MRSTKRRIEPFTFFNTTAITAHLEKMAQKGWMIDNISNMGWRYRRIPPQQLKFAISFYPKASQFDPEPTEGQKVFLEFCAHTGWELACASGQLQIFYNGQENPVPIETEPALEVHSIHASFRKSLLPSYIALMVLGLLQGGMFVSALLGNPIATLANPSQLMIGIACVAMFVLCITELVSYFIWHSKAGKAAENGRFLAPPNTAPLQKGILAVVFLGVAVYFVDYMLHGDSLRRWILVIMGVYMPTLYFLVNATKEFLKRQKASREVNRVLTFLSSFLLAFALMGILTGVTMQLNSGGFFERRDQQTYEHNGKSWILHNDELPLVVEDLLDVDPEQYTKQRSGDESFLLGNLTMRQHVRFDMEGTVSAPQLEYRVVLVKWPILYRLCKERLIYEREHLKAIEDHTYQPQDPAPWGAQEIYRLEDPEFGLEDRYLLCYEDILVELRLDWEPTEAQKQIIGQKLNG